MSIATIYAREDPTGVLYDAKGLLYDPEGLLYDAKGLPHDAEGLPHDAEGLLYGSEVALCARTRVVVLLTFYPTLPALPTPSPPGLRCKKCKKCGLFLALAYYRARASFSRCAFVKAAVVSYDAVT